MPSNLVRRVVDDLQKFGRVRRGSIGYVEVIPLTARLAGELRAPASDGVVVNQMSRDSAAYKNGLEPGDIILSVNGTDHRRSVAVRPADRRQQHRLDRAHRDSARGPALDAPHPDRSPARTPRPPATR